MKNKVLNIPIDNISFENAIEAINKAIQANGFHQIATVNAEFVIGSQKDEKLRKILNHTFLNLADSVGIVWAMKTLHDEKIERIPGVDLTWSMLKLAEDTGYRVFLLGGWPEEITKATEKNIKMVHPKINIVGTSSLGPKDEGVVETVNSKNPDILFVAYGGSSKQEKFIYNNKEKLNTKIAIGVGGTFDFISGNIKRAPHWMRKIGLEWLYRLVRQPSRIGRIFNATIKFPLLVLKEKYFNKNDE